MYSLCIKVIMWLLFCLLSLCFLSRVHATCDIDIVAFPSLSIHHTLILTTCHQNCSLPNSLIAQVFPVCSIYAFWAESTESDNERCQHNEWLAACGDVKTYKHDTWMWHTSEWVSEWVSSVLRPHHSIGYTGDGFYRSKDPTNSIKVLKENLQNTKKRTKTTKYRYT